MKPFSIAVAGKGGVGKTTFAGMLINRLVLAGRTPVLAVDADPNSNLYLHLGLGRPETVSDLRDSVVDRDVPAGMVKTEYVSLKLQECVAEGKGVDLITMGRPEGPGCYCAVNNLLRTFLSNISRNYRYVVMDNEAGMEHLSRRTTDDVDLLFLISDTSRVGINSIIDIKHTAERIKLGIKKTYAVINRVRPAGIPESVTRYCRESGLEVIGSIGHDQGIEERSESGEGISSLSVSSVPMQEMLAIMERSGMIEKAEKAV